MKRHLAKFLDPTTTLCRLTGRHRGRVGQNDTGIYWQCNGPCKERIVTPWAEVRRATGSRY